MLTKEQRNANRREARAAREFHAYFTFKAEIVRVYSCARPDKGGWTYEQILGSMRDVWQRVNNCKHLTVYTKTKLRGVQDCMLDTLWRDVIVSTCVLDGERIRSTEVPEGRWADTSDPQCGVFRPSGEFVAFLGKEGMS